jgi:Recombinase zinc beta ribbon domain
LLTPSLARSDDDQLAALGGRFNLSNSGHLRRLKVVAYSSGNDVVVEIYFQGMCLFAIITRAMSLGKSTSAISGSSLAMQTRKGEIVPGAVRNGGGLLVGLLRCGHCGRKLRVHSGRKGAVRYECNDARINHGARTSCIAFGNLRIDAAVSEEILRVIAPLGLDAALQAIAEREHAGTEQMRQRDLALAQARYEADRAYRQYNG